MPAGRKPTYRAEFHIPWVKSLARTGLTVEEIAHELGIVKQTLYNWASNDPQLMDALNEGRQYADSKVEDSLYKLAIGSKQTVKKTIVSAGGDGQQKPLRVEITETDLLPNATACIFWLKNRQPQIWRERMEEKISIAPVNLDETVKQMNEYFERQSPETSG